MAGDSKKLQPIIVKRIKKGGHAAHGGAWKIAYADFVTAMMAFFLLMWLLGSTTEGDKKGIADYFNSPLKIALLGGSGSGDSSSVIKGGGKELTRTTGQTKNGDIEAKKRTFNLQALKAEQRAAESDRLKALKGKMEEVLAGNTQTSPYKAQIQLDMTRDGLRIQINDDQNRPMYASGSAVVQPYMRAILQAIGGVLGEVPNKLTIEGHTDAQAFSAGDLGYSNWELSADRANAARRELVAGGLPVDKVIRVQGLAASMPFDKTDPNSPMNRRISVIVMTRDAEESLLTAGEPPTAASAASAAEPALSAGLPSR